MTQAVSSPCPLPDVEHALSNKTSKEAVVSDSYRSSSDPEGRICTIKIKNQQRNEPLYVEEKFKKRRLLSVEFNSQSQVESLDFSLKGKQLDSNQRKKKKILNKVVVIPQRDGGPISLSQYLHESGFSYDSQASMVSLKSVCIYTIYYLVALFLEKFDMHLEGGGVKKTVVNRISNKWRTIQGVLTEVDLDISVEDAVLSLLKSQGSSYENVCIFLDLFEKGISSAEQVVRGTQNQYPMYEELSYPFSKRHFLRNVLEIAKSGSVSLEGFVHTFLKPSSVDGLSDWEMINNVFLEDLVTIVEKKSNLVGCAVRYNGFDWTIVSDKDSEPFGRQIGLEKVGGGDDDKVLILIGENKTFWILNEDFEVCKPEVTECIVKESDVTEMVILKHLVQCLKHNGGVNNKKALIDSFIVEEIYLYGQAMSIYTYLRSKWGGEVSASEAFHIIATCVGHGGGVKNKTAFIECLTEKNIPLDGENATLYDFLRSEQGGSFSASEALHIIAKCIGHDGGAKNMKAFMECLIKPEIKWGRYDRSLFWFLQSEWGGSYRASEAIQMITSFLGHDGGSKNKQTFIDCLMEPEVNLNGKKVTLYHFARSEEGGSVCASEVLKAFVDCTKHTGGSKNKSALISCLNKLCIELNGTRVTFYKFLWSRHGIGLSATEALAVIIKCVSHGGGAKSLQALITSLTQPEINLNGKKVSIFKFIQLQQSGRFGASEALKIVVRFISHSGGAKNKQALMDCLCKPEVMVEGARVSIYQFLCSEHGGGLTPVEALEIIIKCISHCGGALNFQAFKECLTCQEITLNGQSVTVFEFLKSENGGGGNCASDALGLILKCTNHRGGSKNKFAFIECFQKPVVFLNRKKVSIYDYFKSEQGGRLGASEILDVLIKCVNHTGGSKNMKALIDCLINLDIDLYGKKMTFYNFLRSDLGCGYVASEALQIIGKIIGHGAGAKNRQAFIECLNKREVDLNGKIVPFYTFLQSEEGGGVSASVALQLLVRAVGSNGGGENKKALIDCFEVKFLTKEQDRKSFFELLLTTSMTQKEALSLCLNFSMNRHAFNMKDVLKLFSLTKGGAQRTTVAERLESLDISCYDTILNLVTKVENQLDQSSETRKRLFSLRCQSLVSLFGNSDGFFAKKECEHPEWNMTFLAERCIDACMVYRGKDINKELKERESLVGSWSNQFSAGYPLTMVALDVVVHVQSTDELKELIELSSKEIEGEKSLYRNDYCYEDSLSHGSQILLGYGRSTIQVILKYSEMLLSWFTLKELCYFLTSWWGNKKMSKSISYFFQNHKNIQALMPTLELRKSFLIYMGLSSKSPVAYLPVEVSRIQAFFEILGADIGTYIHAQKSSDLCILYAIYYRIPEQRREACFDVIKNKMQEVFGSFMVFQNKYLKTIQRNDWFILSSLMKKWDLKKDNLTQDEFSLLKRIKYQFPDKPIILWYQFTNLESFGEGCKVVNKTECPNWVFSLFFLQQIRSILESDYIVIERRQNVSFESFNDIEIQKYTFPLHRIRLIKDGFLFEDESVNQVKRFYSQCGVSEWIGIWESTDESPTKLNHQDRGDSTSKETSELPESVGGEADNIFRFRKRGAGLTYVPPAKRGKGLNKQQVLNLFDTVSKRDVLTMKNCEMLMNGACYLSEKMINVLSKKETVIEVGSDKVSNKWKAFLAKHYESQFEKALKELDAII